jgi:hypothetical protein
MNMTGERVRVALSPILQGHRVLVIYDDILLLARGGQLRSLPLLRALGLERFTYNRAWNRYDYRFCDYQYVHLDSSSDFGGVEPPLCQIIDQGTEDASQHDITLRLMGSDAFTPGRPFVLVTRPNFKLRGVTELKSMAEARGFLILRYHEDLLRRPGLLASLGVEGEALTYELLDATGNLVLLQAASRLYRATGQRVKSVLELLPHEPDLVRRIGLWHLVEQIDETYLADPSRTQFYLLDCLRPWVEHGYRTRVKGWLMELFQSRRDLAIPPQQQRL